MRKDHYPHGTVQALLVTDRVRGNTRNVLKKRLEKIQVTIPSCFDGETFFILRAVCMRLIPQLEENRAVELAGCLDSILAEVQRIGACPCRSPVSRPRLSVHQGLIKIKR